jgi:hypothetical protein
MSRAGFSRLTMCSSPPPARNASMHAATLAQASGSGGRRREIGAADRLLGLRRRIARGVDQHDAMRGRDLVERATATRDRRRAAHRAPSAASICPYGTNSTPSALRWSRATARQRRRQRRVRKAARGRRVEPSVAPIRFCVELDRDDRPAAPRERAASAPVTSCGPRRRWSR